MKIRYKVAIPLVAVLALSWIAPAYFGAAHLEAQLYRQKGWTWAVTRVDHSLTQQGRPTVRVRFLRALAPLYFEAHVTVQSHVSRYDRAERALGGYDRVSEETVSCLYTPWRIYSIKVAEQSSYTTPETVQIATLCDQLLLHENAALRELVAFLVWEHPSPLPDSVRREVLTLVTKRDRKGTELDAMIAKVERSASAPAEELKRPIQSPEPTPMSVPPSADTPVAPATGAAHP